MDRARNAARKLRLDELLVERGFFASRSRARDAVVRGTVAVDGATAAKAGQAVAENAEVVVSDPARAYVSRGALKLIAALDGFDLDVKGRVALDIGASTGGFTQVLLERGATRVFAIDVGHGQLDPALAADSRVSAIEGLNARDLTVGHFEGTRPDFLVCDVSFISITLALPAALDLAAPGASGVFLVKPQFEAGREAIGKGGLLKDPADAERAARRVADWLASQRGWGVLGLESSPIEGGDGNREFLLAGRKSP
ncbi:MAG: TlyA family RNA methyltransferase [Rhizobiaceae bacterium]|nr:TlyA family RNA methyltransferase [Rhizobiaceae bacterium]